MLAQRNGPLNKPIDLIFKGLKLYDQLKYIKLHLLETIINLNK